MIGSEFLPHLDEGAIWARGTLAPSTGPTEGIAADEPGAHRAGIVPRSDAGGISQVGRPDDGTDTTGFFNTEYFVDLKPKEQWRPVFHQDKEELIAAMDRELEKIPGVLWNFSQPIADNMEEAVSGVKGELAIKIYGRRSEDCSKQKGDQIVKVMRHIRGHRGSGPVSRDRPAQSELHRGPRAGRALSASTWPTCRTPSRPRWAATRSARCCRASSATTWCCAICRAYRDTKEAIENIRLRGAHRGARLAGAALQGSRSRTARRKSIAKANSRYVAIKYSVRGRDLGSTVEEAISKVDQQVKLPAGYTSIGPANMPASSARRSGW